MGRLAVPDHQGHRRHPHPHPQGNDWTEQLAVVVEAARMLKARSFCIDGELIGSTPTGTPTDEPDPDEGIAYTSEQVTQNIHDGYTGTIQRLIQANAVLQAALDNAMIERAEDRAKIAAYEAMLAGPTVEGNPGPTPVDGSTPP